jgi:hypothetical protein
MTSLGWMAMRLSRRLLRRAVAEHLAGKAMLAALDRAIAKLEARRAREGAAGGDDEPQAPGGHPQRVDGL